MPLTCDDIGKAIRDAIRDSSAVRAECQSLFSTNHSVYYGATGTRGAPKEDFPTFTVIPWGKDRGEDEGRTERVFTFGVMLEIEDSAKTEDTTGDGVKYVEFRGPKSLEDLLDLAMTAIDAISNEISFDDKTTELEPVERFPVFEGALTLTVTYPILIGGFEPSI